MSAADMLDQDPTPVDLSIGPPPAPTVATADGGADYPTGPDVWDDPAPELPEVPEPVVRGILASAGTLLAMSPLADPDVPAHWAFTESELDALTPPMARIVNARPALRQAAAHGDEVTVAVQLLGYGGRNLLTGAAARRARNTDPETEWITDGHEQPEAGSASPGSHGDDGTSVGDNPRFGEPGSVGYGITPPAD